MKYFTIYSILFFPDGDKLIELICQLHAPKKRCVVILQEQHRIFV